MTVKTETKYIHTVEMTADELNMLISDIIILTGNVEVSPEFVKAVRSDATRLSQMLKESGYYDEPF